MSDVVILWANNHSINKIDPIYDLDKENKAFGEDDELPRNFTENLCTLEPFVEDIVSYNGGFIVRTLLRRKICETYKPHLPEDGKSNRLSWALILRPEI